MWAFVLGFLGGRALRNAGQPDSVKQARFDARQARRVPRVPSEVTGPSRSFRLTVVVLAVCIVAGLGYIMATH